MGSVYFVSSSLPPPPQPHARATHRTEVGDVKGIAQESKGHRKKAPRRIGSRGGQRGHWRSRIEERLPQKCWFLIAGS